ncbi:MAG: Crp/Fnr family transcriptional regulator [Candidatus Kapaibacterium sp.]
MSDQPIRCAFSDCEHCSARDNSFFFDLSPAEREEIAMNRVCRSYAKGEMIFYAEEAPSGLFCIHKGQVKIYKVGRDGREQIVRLAGSGDIVGYRSLMSGEAYSAYAVPLERAEICFIPKGVFFSVLSANPSLAQKMLTLISRELREAEEKIVDLAQRPVSERLAEALLMLKETYGVERDMATLNVRMTRIDLANIVGTATESVSRVLSKLKQEKIVDIHGRRIKIIDHPALVARANIND